MITVAEARQQMAALEARMHTPARTVADLGADLARQRATWGPESPASRAPGLDIVRVQRAVDAAVGGPAARLGYAEGLRMIADLEAIVRSPKLRRLPEPQRRAVLLEINRITLDLAAQVRDAMKPPARPAVYATTYPPRRRSPLPAEWLR